MESSYLWSGSQQPELPPGFRFHPSDEELVVHYLKRKVASAPLPVPIIAELDIYKFDPWELPAKAVFSPRERKYPNGMRPNRAATSGYWKATGTDKPVLTAGGNHKVGVKKALVFYGGRPPKGIKTNWIMHEYRLIHNTKPLPLPSHFPNKKPSPSASSLRLDDWVLCRIYKKNKAQLQMPMDQEGDGHIHSALIPPLMCNGQQKFVENDMLDGMMNDDKSLLPQLHLLPHNPAKRTFYWNDEEEGNANSPSTKRFLAENNESPNSVTTILSQLPAPQTPSLLGDEVFGQEQYQVQGVNWYP